MRRLTSAHIGVLLFLGGALSLSWQLWGLRYTNHDDIQLNLYSRLFAGHESDIVTYVAHAQARIQAFVNIPVLLWADGLSASTLYDLLNVSTIVVCYAALLFLLSKLGSLKGATGLVATTLLLFPLHYYYTFPQGYPVMACMWLTCSLIASGLLGGHLQKPCAWKYIVSIGLFTCSLWGSEFNLVLHPALLIAPIISSHTTNARSLAQIAFPYIAGWIATVAIYWAYSNVMHMAGADPEGRTVASFHLGAWLETFVTLEEKAFLPVALWTGIHLNTAASQGVPEVPPILTFSTIFGPRLDTASLVIVFLATWVFFATGLRQIHLTVRSLAAWCWVFLSVLVIPSGVLAVSSRYQTVISAGYIEGHLSTFYSQLGATGLAVIFLSWVCDRLLLLRNQMLAQLLASSLLAAMATITFVYNNLNRQVMNANAQKWQAMNELVEFVDVNEPDLKAGPIEARAFWTSSGVSVIPSASDPFYDENYWTKYSHAVLGSALTFSDSDHVDADGFQTSYFATPSGIPVVILYKPNIEHGRSSVTFISHRSVSGTLFFRFMDGSAGKETLPNSLCSGHCVTRWNYDRRINFSSVRFCPSASEPDSLIEQFFGDRGGGYGLPIAEQQRVVCSSEGDNSSDAHRVASDSVLAYDNFDATDDWSKSNVPSTAILKGSYSIEPGGMCWIAAKATIKLRPPFDHGIQVKGYIPISVHRKANPALQDIAVEVHINGQKVASVVETDDKPFDLNINVPRELQGATLELELSVSDIVNPARAHLGPDQRDLGVVISVIRVLQ